MKRRSYIFPLLFIATVFLTFSCLDSDDDNNIDSEWKYQNETAFGNLPLMYPTNGTYNPDGFEELRSWKAQNDGVYVLHRTSNTFDNTNTLSAKIAPDGKAEFTDTVYVRYDGWYVNFKNNNDTIIFDSTERPITGSTTDPKKLAVSGVVDGWTTVLMDMKVGEEREIAIPWQLAYGAAGYSSIPGYTTLRFTIKLERIIPMKGKS